MGLEFEGALDHVSETQLDFIRDILQKRGYNDNKVTIEAVGKPGENYSSNIKRIIVRNENNEFRMVAKLASQIDFIRKSMQSETLFKNETTMYKRVLTKFQELEEQADVPKEDRLRFAECYGSLSESPHEVILLEDLQVPGFVILDRFKPLTDECIKSVLRNFAILHSLSYALKHKDIESFNDFKGSLVDLWSNASKLMEAADYFTVLENTAIGIVEGEERKRLLKRCIRESAEQAAKMVKYDTGLRRNVIQQGDAWTNNVMFKFNGVALEQSIMIDYQLSKENSPVSDIMYCIFNCTDHDTRLLHFNDWIEYYHSELDRALSNYGLKANYIFPRDQLDADLKRYGKLMLGVSVVVTSVMLTKTENAAIVKEAMENADKLDEVYKDVKLDEDYLQAFKKKVEGLLDSFVQFGLL